MCPLLRTIGQSITTEDRYERYVDYCRLVGVESMNFNRWFWVSQQLDNLDVGTWERQLRYGSDLAAD